MMSVILITWLLVTLALVISPDIVTSEEFEMEVDYEQHPTWRREVVTGPDGSPMTWEEYEAAYENYNDRRRRESTYTEKGKGRKGPKDNRPASRFYTNATKDDVVGLGRSVGTESIPAGGNAFELIDLNSQSPQNSYVVKDDETGFAGKYVRVFYHMSKQQKLVMAIRCRSVSGRSEDLRVQTGGREVVIKVSNSRWHEVQLPGEFDGKKGYVKTDLYGSPGRVVFSHVIVRNKDPDNEITYIRPGFSYHFGRRGPSVHFNFDFKGDEAEYCYTEIKVNPTQNQWGSYFMAIGFDGGYFGIQNNDKYTRKVIFSVWSDYNSQKSGTGNEIPSNLRVQTLHSIRHATVANFGHEGYGSSIQQNMMWDVNKRYRFVVRITKAGDRHKLFSAWIAPEGGNFVMVGKFKKPISRWTPWLSFYSFLENFEPNLGHLVRGANYGNQWCRTTSGKWKEITETQHTCDDTCRNGRRLDHRGGMNAQTNAFWMEMGGFMDTYTKTPAQFVRQPGPRGYVDQVIGQLPNN